jgi:hypothetical protein
VVLNIIQRRTAHLQTNFTVRHSRLVSIAPKLVAVKSKVLRSVAEHLEKEGKYSELTSDQKSAMDLLKHVNTIAARIPGSQAANIYMGNEIHAQCISKAVHVLWGRWATASAKPFRVAVTL